MMIDLPRTWKSKTTREWMMQSLDVKGSTLVLQLEIVLDGNSFAQQIWLSHPWGHFLPRSGSKLFRLEQLSDRSAESPLWHLPCRVDWGFSKSTGLSSLTVQAPPVQFKQWPKNNIWFHALQIKNKTRLGKACERTEISECKVYI